MSFYGRKIQLESLEQVWNSEGPRLVVLRGRRGVGKTALLRHFLGQDRRHCYFLTSCTSLKENIIQLAEAIRRDFPDCDLANDEPPTVPDLLDAACQAANNRRVALVIDEPQYLLNRDASLVIKISKWWESVKPSSGIIIVLCGSDREAMRSLVNENSPLSGQINLDIELKPMSLFETAKFYSNNKYSTQDYCRIHGAFGGMPKHHIVFSTDKSIEENIQDAILSPQGSLHNEPESMLLANGVRDPAVYNAVLRAIADGYTRSSAIAERVGIASNKLSFYIESLVEMGWVSKEHPFDSAAGQRAIYRIDDVFVRFWYSFVAGLQSELEFGEPQVIYDNAIAPRMECYMRRVFVDIGHSYLQLTSAWDMLHQSVLRSGRWWNQDGSEEIDIVAELTDGSHLIGECVWTSSPTGVDVYHKLKDKASRLLGAKYVENASYLIVCSAGRDDELKQVAGTNGLYVAG